VHGSFFLSHGVYSWPDIEGFRPLSATGVMLNIHKSDEKVLRQSVPIFPSDWYIFVLALYRKCVVVLEPPETKIPSFRTMFKNIRYYYGV